MSDLTDRASSGPLSSVFVVLRRERGYFRDCGERGGQEPRFQSALRRLLLRSCERVTDVAEIRGRLYTTSLYLSAAEPDVAYAETDTDGVPTDAAPVPPTGPQLDEYADRVTSQCRISDALTPDLRIPLDAAFIPPRFEMQGASGTVELAWERLSDYTRVVILGKPGAGKTSSLRRLALDSTSGRIGRGDTLPLFVQLRDFPVDELTVAGVTRLLRGERVPDPDLEFRESLGAARLLLLLDGLDELPTEEERTAVLDNLQRLCAEAPRLRVVLTSRHATYDGGLDGFVHLRLLPFDEARVAQWALQYLALHEPSRRWSTFVEGLTDDGRLRDLVRNPLLLSLITSLSCTYSQATRDVAGLLGRCVDLLVHDWDAARGIARWRHSEVTPRQIFALLTPLSALLAAEQREEFTAADVHRVIHDHVGFRVPQTVLLSACHTSGLVEDIGTDYWRFTHRSLKDYLAASHLVRRTDDLDDDFSIFFGGQGSDERHLWTLSCGLASDADDLLRGALDRQQGSPQTAAVMVAEALAQDVAASRTVIDRCCDFITSFLESELRGMAPITDQRTNAPADAFPGRVVVWSAGMTADDSGPDLARTGRLLAAVHRARDGTAGEVLTRKLASSTVPTVQLVAGALTRDGRWQDVTAGAEFWMAVTQRATAEDSGTVPEASPPATRAQLPREA